MVRSTLLFIPILLFVHHASSAPLERADPGARKRASMTDTTASWALARIAQPKELRTMDPIGYEEDADGHPIRATSADWRFPYDDTWGDGVLVYVVDSGVRSTHEELVGRVEDGWVHPDFPGVATEDFCDHGTAVASLIAGNTVGVARKATIVPVRIADASRCGPVPSTSADVAAGVRWAISDYKNRKSSKAGIINISWLLLQLPESEAALQAAIDDGMHVIMAAGNSNSNRCFNGPADLKDQQVKPVGQLIVGMINYFDQRVNGETGSNYGSCLTLWAPGFMLRSASGTDDQARTPSSYGTSLAAPLVAGTIAALVSVHGNSSPSAMKQLLIQNAVHSAGIRDLNDSPDILLQSPMLTPSANLQ
ncbi:peptidase S8/S53 domain-containing protein [Mycena leptocephala]|nr:peptidase S8/S53 domain-containing protein [Mycena leptocephala]